MKIVQKRSPTKIDKNALNSKKITCVQIRRLVKYILSSLGTVLTKSTLTSLSRDEYMRFENEHTSSQTDKSVVGMKFKNEIDTRSDKNGVINQREITNRI